MFFSIVIPTRNRPKFTIQSIRSILDQDFGDFEIIVSDNSSPEHAPEVKKHVDALRDSRIRYIRPDYDLPMAEHWDWAVLHATGDYVGILTDRMVLKRQALKKLQRIIQKHDPPIISYIWDEVSGDRPPYRYSQRKYTGAVLLYSSSALLDTSAEVFFPHLLPRGLNMFCRASFMEDLRKTYGKVFGSIAPDYYFCYNVLDHLDQIHYLDAPMSIVWGNHVSNGANVLKGRVANEAKDFLNFIKNKGMLSFSPIQIKGENFKPIPYNFHLLEYNFALSRQKSGRLKPVVKESFYLKAMQKLLSLEKQLGIDMKSSKDLLEDYRIENNLQISMSRNGFRAVKSHGDFKRLLKKLGFPLACWLTDNFGLSIGLNDLSSRPKGAFQDIEKILNFDESHPRRPEKVYRAPHQLLQGQHWPV
jgi:glycosyltransferase involved in cell wall biosynthesis